MNASAIALKQESYWSKFSQALLKWESVLFATLCIADMLTTLYMIHNGFATEANPMLARVLEVGVATFCLVKLASFVPMLCFAAWYRLQNPKFIENALRCGLLAYVVIYVVGTGGQLIR